jgi:DNA-directed RNA polymerase subunit RPC12/RpoP
VSHRRKGREPAKAPQNEPVACRHCGSTEILYGKRRGLCKKCRNIVRRPKGGWVDADGNKIVVTVFQCGRCERLFSKKRGESQELPVSCPKCGSTDAKVVETW